MTEAQAASQGHVMMMLTDRDRDVIAAMTELGIPRTAAACFIAMYRYRKDSPVTQFWLDRATDLQQPQVCGGLHWLKEQGLITKATEDPQSKGKGRPLKVYTLTAKSMNAQVRQMVLERGKALQQSVETLKAVWPGEFS